MLRLIHIPPSPWAPPSRSAPRLSKPSALVPPHLSNRDPPYLLVGGLVFVTASEPYLQVREEGGR